MTAHTYQLIWLLPIYHTHHELKVLFREYYYIILKFFTVDIKILTVHLICHRMVLNEMVHISFWFMLIMSIHWEEAYIL